MASKKDEVDFVKKVPIIESVDVLVVGGGPSGIAAATASARNGAKTMLVEQYGFLGGTATASLVGPFMTSFTSDGKTQNITGIFEEIVSRMVKIRGAIHPSKIRHGTSYSSWLGYGHDHVTPYQSEALKTVAFEIMQETGVKLLLHSFFIEPIMDKNLIQGAIFANKSGLQGVRAYATIDCTGDADVAALAGAPFKKGREADGLMQPVTMFFSVRNVDDGKLQKHFDDHPDEKDKITPGIPKTFGSLIKEAKKHGDFPLNHDIIGAYQTNKKGEYLMNASRLHNIDGTEVNDLTKAEIEGHKQVEVLMNFLHKYVPGFEKAELTEVGSTIGVRETRHIIGEYILTQEDVQDPKGFDDVIALSSFPVDIHDPVTGGGYFEGLRKGVSFEIPYRSLVPLKVEQLLVAGRPISATHSAAGAIREMPQCFATGQAAGTAAALSLKSKVPPRKIDIQKLQKTLISQNVYLPERIRLSAREQP